MLEITNLRKKYGDFDALKGISFNVEKGEIVAFLGPNGAGKTTTMRIITGYLEADNGKVRLDGKSVKKNRMYFAENLGYLPEGNPLYSDLKVDEQLILTARLKGLNITTYKRELKKIAAKCNLTDVLTKNISSLSRGYKQRVGLAMALIGDPRFLVLDEPTSGLDPNQADQIKELIKDIKNEKAILFSTHILSEVDEIADRIVIINKGKIVAEGKKTQLITRFFKTKKVYLKLSGDTKNFETSAKKIKGIKIISTVKIPKDKLLSVELEVNSKMNIVETIYDLCSKQKFNLYDIHISERTLKDVFQKLTK